MIFSRALYTGALRIATPFALLHLARRTRRQAGTHDNWRARLGLVAPDLRHPIWIHAASAGEMQAAAVLAAALVDEFPVRITAFSATGLAVVARLVPEAQVDLAPLDLPGAWRHYLARTRPRLAILVETELWPNLLAEAARQSLPVVLASARLTPRAARRLTRVPVAVRAMLVSLERVLAQSRADLDRFVALGLPAERGRLTGNLKDALVIPRDVVERGKAMRTGPFAGRKIWIAGSVRTGEEAAVSEAAAAVRDAVPDSVAIIVPRHPEDAPVFARALTEHAFSALDAAALEAGSPLPAGSAVVVAQVGVLLALYAAADVAFVGGTLVPLQGHNLLEPAFLGVPVIAGPSLDNVRAQAERLYGAGALTIVRNGATLGSAVRDLLGDPAAARAAGDAARRTAADPAVLTETLAELRDLLSSRKAGLQGLKKHRPR